MRITKIELENITTHVNTVVEFQQGLNLLFGKNGSGKSTVLKMIGFVLFDYLPGNQKNYVRESSDRKKRFGNVKVWVVGLNDDHFIIQRSLAKSKPLIEVIDARTEVILPGINNADTLKEWLKTQLSLSDDVDLSDLFRTSIGVPQGTFTEPFLRTPQKRKDYFNPILRVDLYRTVWQNFLELVKLFDYDLIEANNKLTEYKTRLEPKSDLVERHDNCEQNLLNSIDELNKTKMKLLEIGSKYEMFKEINDQLNNSTNQNEKLELQLNSLQTIRNSLVENYDKSKEAYEICKQQEQKYHLYDSLTPKEKELESDYNRIHTINEELSDLSNKLTELESTRLITQKQINEITQHQTRYSNLKTEVDRLKEIQKLSQVQRDKIVKIEAQEDELNKINLEEVEVNKVIKKLKKDMKAIPSLEKELKVMEDLKSEAHSIELEIQSLKTEIKNAENNRSNSIEGNCPILNEPCKNIGKRSFNAIFSKKISEIKSKLIPKEDSLKFIEDKLTSDLHMQNQMKELSEKEGILKTNEKLLSDLEIKESKLSSQISLKSKEASILGNLESQIKEMDSKIEEYNVLKNKFITELPKLESQLKDVEQGKNPLLQKSKPLEKEKEKLKGVPDKLREIKDTLNGLRPAYDLYNSNKKLASTFEDTEKNLISNQEKIDEIQNKLEITNNEIIKLSSDFNIEEYKELEKIYFDLTEIKGRLKEKVEESETLLKEFKTKIKSLETVEMKLNETLDKVKALSFMKYLIETLRSFFNVAGPKITEALLHHINKEATNHYRNLMDDPNVILKWEKDFLITVKTSENEKEFHQLSGGEQMAAALAVRLAVLKILSNAEFAFFDEPTMNLDTLKRENLAKIIQRIKGFEQLFVISHDDTFEENVENVISFDKNENEITIVDYIGKTEDIPLEWDD